MQISALADLEVHDKFFVVVVVGGEHVATMSNSNASWFKVALK